MLKIIKSKYIWILIIMIIYFIGMVYLLGTNKEEGYILISNISNLKCNKENCKNVETREILNLHEPFLVFHDETKKGEYNLDYVNKWNFFDQDGNWQNVSDGFIATTSNMNTKLKKITTRQMNEEESLKVNKLLSKNGISKYSSLSQNEVLSYDFNKDNKEEKIIIASNITEETEDEVLFTIIVSIVNNKATTLLLDTKDQYENYKAPAYVMKTLINIFNNQEDYLVITKGYFSEVGKSSSIIYKLDKKTFKNIVGN